MSDGHFINVRSVQEYSGGFDADFLTDDGGLHESAQDLQFEREKSLSFTCSCGRIFLTWDTAADHLRELESEQ